MTTSAESAWPHVYGALFGKEIDPKIAAAIDQEIKRRVNDLFGGEISHALRSISKDNAREMENKYPPSGEEIIQRILRNRREKFSATEKRNACAHCHHGWLQFRFYVETGGPIKLGGFEGHVLHPDDAKGGMPSSCPCKCSLGDALVNYAITPKTEHDYARTSKLLANELRDAVWDARLTYARQMTRDEGKQSDIMGMARDLEKHFESQEANR